MMVAKRLIPLVERVLLVSGLLALTWWGGSQIATAREQAALSRELAEARAQAQSSAGAEVPSVLGKTAVASRPASPAPGKRAVIGRIDVPRLKLSALAREGVDVRTLRGSVGHVPGTALPGGGGNAAFAAHRDTFFAPLRDVRRGDEVVVTTPDAVHRYVVTSTRVVAPNDVSVLSPTSTARLTLVTCYPFDYIGSAPKRFIVTASLVPEPAASHP